MRPIPDAVRLEGNIYELGVIPKRSCRPQLKRIH